MSFSRMSFPAVCAAELVLDEPLRELDEATAQAVLHVVQESIAGRTLVLVTHDRQQAEILGCRMISMPQ